MNTLKLIVIASGLFWTRPGLAQPTDSQAETGSTQATKDAAVAQAEDLIEERLRFVREMYDVDGKLIKKLEGELKLLISSHASYMEGSERLLRRRKLGLDRVIPRREIGEDIKQIVRARLLDEIYTVHAKAPLSLANTVKMLDSRLPREEVDRAHKKIRTKYASLLRGETLDIDRLDRILLRPVYDPHPDPVRMPAARQGNAANRAFTPPTPPANAPPGTLESIVLPPTRRSPPEIASRPPKTPRLGRRTDPPSQLKPAPPIDEWVRTLESATTRYKFNEDQSATAESILQSCRHRAETYVERKKEAYAKARSISDAGEKAKAITKLNRTVDRLYNELNRRFDSIASAEQRQNAKQKPQPQSK